MRLSSSLSNRILKTSSDGDSTMSLGRLLQWLIVLTVKNFLYRYKTSLTIVCTHCPLYSHVAPCGKRASVLFVAAAFQLPEYCDEVPPVLLFSRDTPSVFPYKAGSPALWSSLQASIGPSPVCLCLSWITGNKTGHSTPSAAWLALSGMITSPSLLVMPLQMQSWIWFAPVATAALCSHSACRPPGLSSPFH